MALGTAALFFASPHYPWYFVYLVALLTAAPWWPAWWLTLAAVLLLVVNDWVLKPRFHDAVTGKLSDLAGLAFAPVLLSASKA